MKYLYAVILFIIIAGSIYSQNIFIVKYDGSDKIMKEIVEDAYISYKTCYIQIKSDEYLLFFKHDRNDEHAFRIPIIALTKEQYIYILDIADKHGENKQSH